MRRGDLNKRIEIHEVTKAADGFGGYTISSALVTTTWAKAEPSEGEYVNDGKIEAYNSVKFTFRKRNDLTLKAGDHFIKYRGVSYSISSMIESKFGNNFIVVRGHEN